jgi:hypothetical protein
MTDTRTHAQRAEAKQRLAQRQKLAYIYVKQEAACMGQTVDKFLQLNLKPEAAKDG